MFRNDLTFIHKYFMAEKQAALVFMILGGTAMAAGLVTYFLAKANPLTMKGLSIPFVVIGLLMAAVGVTVYQKADNQRKDIAYQMGLEQGSYSANVEIPRMEKVIKNLNILLYIELLLLLAGAGVFIFYRQDENAFWKGVGMGLVVMSVMALYMDYQSKSRAQKYLTELRKG